MTETQTRFFIRCVPPKSTHQASARIMKRKDGTQFVGKMDNSKGASVKREILTLLSQDRPTDPYTTAVTLRVLWTYPWRKTEKKKNLALGWLPCPSRPDCDNLSKLLKDCMTRLNYWGDDSQVARLDFLKGWGDAPGIGIEITPLITMPEEFKAFTVGHVPKPVEAADLFQLKP